MDKPFIVSETAKIAWRRSQLTEGVFVKDLGTSDGQSMQLVKFEPGVRFPWHRHTGPEFIYVLEGEVSQGGRKHRQESDPWPKRPPIEPYLPQRPSDCCAQQQHE